jgi:hypothetical protein
MYYSEEIRVSCEVRTEFLCIIQKIVVFPVRYELNFCILFRRNSCFKQLREIVLNYQPNIKLKQTIA